MKTLVSILIALACICASAADVYVGTVAALTNALAAASSNDTVWVSNGTYQVNLTVPAYVSVRSVSGSPSDVILDGNAAGRVVVMNTGSWLMGCTVTNGYADWSGGGGVVYGSVSNCIVRNNEEHTISGGGGAYCSFFNSLIINNTAGQNGGGGDGCSFYNCTISGNSCGGSDTGGGAYLSTLINSVSWDNNKADDSCTESYSCGVGYTGTGSITNDPLFVGGGNYRLQSNSPCINTGTNGAWTVGAKDMDGNQRVWPQGGTADMGAYEYGSQSAYPAILHVYISGRITISGEVTISGAGISSVRGYVQ